MTRHTPPTPGSTSAAALEPIERLIDRGQVFLSVKEVAAMLDLTPWSVYQMCSAGVIDSRLQGKRRSVFVTAVRDYIKALPTERPAS